MRLAARVEPPFSGKKQSASVSRQAARSYQGCISKGRIGPINASESRSSNLTIVITPVAFCDRLSSIFKIEDFPVDERRQTGPGRAAALSDSLTPTRRAEATSGGGVQGFGRSQEAGKAGLTAEDMAAARRREPAAVTLIYTAYAPALYRFFMAAVGDRHTAEDLTGEVFKGAIEGLPGFRGPVEALGGWLFRIARHDLYDFRRKQARSPGLAPLDDHLDEAAIAAGADEREVLLLRMAAGLTAPEVAAALHKTTGAVKALQHRGLASLARLLGLRSPHDPPDPPYPSLDPARLPSKEEEQER